LFVGHRSTQAHSLPLKRGIVHYAFSRKMPMQVVITQHKEDLINEKKLGVRAGGEGSRQVQVRVYAFCMPLTPCCLLLKSMLEHSLRSGGAGIGAEASGAPSYCLLYRY
jgi:1-acyl-sn-glycerol-3-phosphate acyltransferase